MNILKTICYAIAVFATQFSYGELKDHLKKAEGKSNDHKMRNIDFIYMINLDKRPEKYALSMQYLEKYGIKPYRFSAVNGWELSVEAINDVGLKYRPGMTALMSTTYPIEMAGKVASHELMKEYGKTYFCHCMARGAIGCALSHISILQDAYDSGYETIWVMEDDIEVIQDPNILSDLIEELDAIVGHGNWDVLFTDYDYRKGVGEYLPAYGAAKRPDLDCSPAERFSDKYTKTVKINDNFRTMAARFGTASMIIRRSGIVKLLKFAKEHSIYLPYDLENYLVPGIKRYGLNYDVVTNMLNSLSDIGVPAYLINEQ
jgi:GR25 family glycosyltransferase involved in LPS biosynthesis